jgi:hypothetical protein
MLGTVQDDLRRLTPEPLGAVSWTALREFIDAKAA